MKLRQLLNNAGMLEMKTGVSDEKSSFTMDSDITGICCDSRRVEPGYAFVCISGTAQDGHNYAGQAVENGAAVVVAERDLGAALLIAGTYLILFYTATGDVKATLVGLGSGCVGAVASYFVFDHVRARVAIWQNPWATYETSGYQIAQGLMAIASGGLWGLGLTQGSPKSIPAYNTDYIFAVICEEFGIIFGIAVIALYLVFIIRGALVALYARDRYLMLVAFGCTVLITLQSFIIIGGVIKLIPLTGITMPFVSHGGSSLIASLMLLGILEGVAMRNGDMLEDAMDAALEEDRRISRQEGGEHAG